MVDMSIDKIELEIDEEFAQSEITSLPYSQAMWTMLSNLEDFHFKMRHFDQLKNNQLSSYVDSLINSITYPLRVIYKKNCRKKSDVVIYSLNNSHYGWAMDWINKSREYDTFNSIFPLWWNKKISIEVKGKYLISTDWKKYNHRYEAYNRLFYKDGSIENNPISHEDILEELMLHTVHSERDFDIRYTPKLAKILIEKYEYHTLHRHRLPDNWKLSQFTFGEFRKLYVCLQALLYGRFIARSVLAMNGMLGLGYSSSVWVVKKDELISRVSRYIKLSPSTVANIIDYLIFGEHGIKSPDAAIQPIINLGSDNLALSPFLVLNNDAERNFCVLLNKISEEKDIYSSLVNEKEELLYGELKKSIEDLGYTVRKGKLNDTDVDLAIIDNQKKACLTIELKWFIEPAEIRETIQREEEIEKGIEQAKKIRNKFLDKDSELIDNVLKIDSTYKFMSCVGTRNWIGGYSVQADDVPVIKAKHLVEYLKNCNSLLGLMKWLENREYLPIEGKDFEVLEMDIHFNKWQAKWYGINPLI